MKKRTAQILCAVVVFLSFGSVIAFSVFSFYNSNQGGIGIIGGADTPTFWLALRSVIFTLPGALLITVGTVSLIAFAVISCRRKA